MSSSRFPPNGESRYPPRDRSPGRFDRRGSTQYSGPPPSRRSDTSYRPGDSYSAPPHDAPRAPKAAQDGSRGGGSGSGAFASRGRGFGGRSESREMREPFNRRESDRDWSRRDGLDPRDRRPSPVNSSRNRSRSPPTRDFREARDGPARGLDLDRINRNVRDGPLSASSTVSDTPMSAGGYFSRGSGYRGGGAGSRGRGDWDSRGRGRAAYSDERDGFKARSRSRDRGWDRDFRDDRPRDLDRDGRRGDDEKRPDWDRDGDRHRRDAPHRPDSRNSGGSQTNPTTPLSATQANADRYKDNAKQSTMAGESSRRHSFASSYGDTRTREDGRSGRPDLSQGPSGLQMPSSPPQATPVPAFGSVATRATPTAQTASPAQPATGVNTPATTASAPAPKEEQPSAKPEVQDPIALAPKAPKAQLNNPRASNVYPKRPAADTTPGIHRYDPHYDAQAGQSPSMQRFGGPPGRSGSSQPFSAPTQPRSMQQQQWTSPPLVTRLAHADGGSASQPAGGDPNASPSTGLFSAANSKPIPTGPRLLNQPSIRTTVPRAADPAAGATRRNSGHAKAPSIMKPMIPTKRDSIGEERKVRPGGAGQPSPGLQRVSASILGNREHGSVLGSVYADDGSKMEVETDAPAQTVSESVEQAESASEDDDGMDLSEEDFEDAEKVFEKDMENLRARRPPAPSHHPELMLLLDEVDALASAGEDLANGILPPSEEFAEAAPTRAPLGLPSPSSDRVDDKDEDDEADEKLELASVSEELPLDGLPYVPSGPLTPVSEMSFTDEPVAEQQEMKRSHNVITALVRERQEEEDEFQRLRAHYAREYKLWRGYAESLDERRRQESEVNRPPSPQPPNSETAGTPTPVAEGRRRGGGDRLGFSTQADWDTVIKQSLETHEREKEDREREALEVQEELPDLTREAVIPDMLRRSQRRTCMFEDNNRLIESRRVLEMFKFVPQPDNFTAEEQEQFINGYVTTPKKWGHIAQWIAGRNYQDCIEHYYLTKKETQYKVIANNRKSKRGRKGRLSGRPRTGALMADLSRTTVAPGSDELTDAGRPKRAAAPVSFGEPKREPVDSVKGTPGRKPGNSAKVSEAGDDKDGAGKPSAGRGSRGGRGAGARREGAGRGRGGKAAAAAAAAASSSTPASAAAPTTTAQSTAAAAPVPLLAPNQSPAKKEADTTRSKSKERRNEDPMRTRELESAQSLVTLQVAQAAQGSVPHAGHTEHWRLDNRPPAAGSAPVDLRAPQAQQQTAQQVQLQQQQQQLQQQQQQQQPQQPVQGQQQQQQQQQQQRETSRPPPMGAEPPPPPPPGQQGAKAATSRSAGQTSSYWSVPEQNEFNNLIRHYGSDWNSIASVLKTKTHVMVKNYFFRQIEGGKKQELEIAAHEADERNKQFGGPPPNPPPAASVPQRGRRADSAPQIAPQPAPQRSLAPNADMADADGEPASMNAAPGAQHGSPPQYAGSRPGLVPLRQAGAPVVPPPAQAIPHDSPPAHVRIQPQSQQRSTSGQQMPVPRTGYFSAAAPTPLVAQTVPRELQKAERDQQQQQQQQSQQLNQQVFTELMTAKHAQSQEAQHHAHIQHQPPAMERQLTQELGPQQQQQQQQQHQLMHAQQHPMQHPQQQHAQQHKPFHVSQREQRQVQENPQQAVQYPPSRQQVQVPPAHQQAPSQQSGSMLHQSRTPQMPAAELDRSRFLSYSLQQKPADASPPAGLRRGDSYGQSRYAQTTHTSPMSRQAALAAPPPHSRYSDSGRPSSVPNNPQAQPPPQPPSAPPAPIPAPTPPTEKKRSNIMMMLNDEPEEPKPPKSVPPPPPPPPPSVEPRSHHPAARHASPAQPMSMYSHPGQPPSQYGRRDPIIEAPPPPQQHHQASLSRHPYGQQSYGSQPPPQHQPVPPPPPPPSAQPEPRQPTDWSSAIHRPYYDRQAYQQQQQQSAPAASPPSQHSYLPQTRSALTQPPRTDSPPASHHSHSRASSYTHAASGPQHTLAPHPYASIAPPPSQHSYPGSSQPPQSQQQQQGQPVPPPPPPPSSSSSSGIPPPPSQSRPPGPSAYPGMGSLGREQLRQHSHAQQEALRHESGGGGAGLGLGLHRYGSPAGGGYGGGGGGYGPPPPGPGQGPGQGQQGGGGGGGGGQQGDDRMGRYGEQRGRYEGGR